MRAHSRTGAGAEARPRAPLESKPYGQQLNRTCRNMPHLIRLSRNGMARSANGTALLHGRRALLIKTASRAANSAGLGPGIRMVRANPTITSAPIIHKLRGRLARFRW